MYYVYLLQSVEQSKIYTGFTTKIETRVLDHNSGHSLYTRKYRPWKLMSYFVFESEVIARDFEKYLKTGSGIAFARKHFGARGDRRYRKEDVMKLLEKKK